jgi:toxin ParE1/3/4
VTPVRWLRRALRDLDDVYSYVAADSTAAAGRLIDQIQTGTELLSRYPELGRAGRVSGTRELVIAGTPFIVVYRTQHSQAMILAIMHGVRRWARAF